MTSFSPRITVFTLDDYLQRTAGISKEAWEHLDSVFKVLRVVCGEQSNVVQVLDDLHAFCHAPDQTKQLMAHNTFALNLRMDNYLLIVLDNTKEYPDESINPEDIVAFILGHRENESIHISQCVSRTERREENYEGRMIRFLCNNVPSIERVYVSAALKPTTLLFFVNLGFTPSRQPSSLLFKNLVTSSPDEVANHPELTSLFNANSTIDLVHFATRCHTCKKEVSTCRRCGRCYTISYCSVECQQKDWPLHRSSCLPTNINK